jgi:hypothetical protein
VTKRQSAITFTATVNQVRTLADGGIRIVLDLAENEIETATALMECKAKSATINVAAIPVGFENEEE